MNSADKKVSVIIPCYNYAQFLGNALESVMAQTHSNWECIIVNDGSPDNTEEVALNFCKKDSRIQYFYKTNGGHSSARNFGIFKSTGKYIMPLDPDDTICVIYLEKAVEVLEQDVNVKLVTGQVQLHGNSNGKLVMPSYNFRSYLIMNCISISSLFRRIDYDNTNGFDETMLAYEDWDFFISLLKTGGVIKQLPFTSLFYQIKDKSVYQDALKNSEQLFKDLLKLYTNHIDVYEKYFDSPILLIQENEKMTRVINAYQQSTTYKIGLKVQKIKKLLSPILKRR